MSGTFGTESHLVEVHTNQGDVYNITNFVNTLSYKESTEPPWDSIDVSLSMPLSKIAVDAFPYTRIGSEIIVEEQAADWSSDIVVTGNLERGYDFSPGLWLKVTEVPSGRVVAFGKITNRPIEHGAGGGGTVATSTQISAIGWFEYLRTLSVEFVPTLRADVGGLISMTGPRSKRYFQILQQLISSPTPRLLEGDDGLVGVLTGIRIPPTLFNGRTTLGGLFEVAYDDRTREEVCPKRIIDEVSTSPSGGLHWVVPKGKVLDLVLGVYQREPRLVEFFPSMEAPTNDPLEAGYQNAIPVLIRRWRPWTTGSISQMAVDTSGGPTLSTRANDRVTWDLSNGLKLSKRDGYRLQSTRNESARTNAVTVNWSVGGGSSERMMGLLGLPLHDREDILKHGVQLMELNWDFTQFETGDDLSDRPAFSQFLIGRARTANRRRTVIEDIRAIAYRGWHYYGLGALFENGSIDGPFLGARARAGEPLTLDYGGKKEFTAYITTVTHTISMVGGGTKSAHTSIGFMRGLWDERARNPHLYRNQDPPPPPQEPPEPPPEPEEPAVCQAGQSYRANSSSSGDPGGPGDFSMSTELDESKVPEWIKSWATDAVKGRGFYSRWFNIPTSQWVYVCVGVAFVIERYWRQAYPEAQVLVTSCVRKATPEHPDDKRNHVDGAAIDFSIKLTPGGKRLGALQTWATLHYLASAGRIPPGAHGLYLNLGSDGITGISMDQTGVATPPGDGSKKPSGTYPRGGSAGAHWALEESFGRSTGEGVRKYLWACTDGTGIDNLKYGEAERHLRTNLPEVGVFYDGEGDTGGPEAGMIQVGLTVPNIMQVLGQIESCFTSEEA